MAIGVRKPRAIDSQPLRPALSRPAPRRAPRSERRWRPVLASSRSTTRMRCLGTSSHDEREADAGGDADGDPGGVADVASPVERRVDVLGGDVDIGLDLAADPGHRGGGSRRSRPGRRAAVGSMPRGSSPCGSEAEVAGGLSGVPRGGVAAVVGVVRGPVAQVVGVAGGRSARCSPTRPWRSRSEPRAGRRPTSRRRTSDRRVGDRRAAGRSGRGPGRPPGRSWSRPRSSADAGPPVGSGGRPA